MCSWRVLRRFDCVSNLMIVLIMAFSWMDTRDCAMQHS